MTFSSTTRSLATACIITAGIAFSVGTPAYAADQTSPSLIVRSDIGQGVGDKTVTIDIHANDAENIDESATRLIDPATGKPAKEVTVENGRHVLVDDADGGVSYQFIPVEGFKGGTSESIYQWGQDTEGGGMTAEILVEIAPAETPFTLKAKSDKGYGVDDKIVTIDIHANDGDGVDEAATRLIDPVTGKPATEVQVDNGTHKIVPDADGGFSYQFVPVAGLKEVTNESIYQWVQDTEGRGMTAEILVSIVTSDMASSTPVIDTLPPKEEAPVVTPDPFEAIQETLVEPPVEAPVVETAPVEVVPAPVVSEPVVEAPVEVVPASTDIAPVVPADVQGEFIAPVVTEPVVEAPVASQTPNAGGEALALTGVDKQSNEATFVGGIVLIVLGAVMALKARASKIAGLVGTN